MAGSNATILADASSCHNTVFGPGRCKGSGCWAHARRPFVKAFREGETRIAAMGLDLIRSLFHIEKDIAHLSSTSSRG